MLPLEQNPKDNGQQKRTLEVQIEFLRIRADRAGQEQEEALQLLRQKRLELTEMQSEGGDKPE